MKNLQKIFFLAILFFGVFALAKSSQAAIIYVDNTTTNCSTPSNTDYNPATDTCGSGIYTVYNTIQGAADVVNPGDTVIVADGVYGGNYTLYSNTYVHILLKRGGTADNWVTFKAENKWGAKINGNNNTLGSAWTFSYTEVIQYVSIEGFEIYGFEYDAVHGDNDKHIRIYQNHVHDIGRMCTETDYGRAAFGGMPGSDYWTIDSNIIHHIGRYQCGEYGCTGTRCGTHDHAIYHTGSYTTIINNIFYENNAGVDINNKGSYSSMSGSYIESGSHNKIINNVFGQSSFKYEGRIDIVSRDSGYTGEVDDVLIENNIFASSNNYAIMFWGINYCGEDDITNIVIKNNITQNENLVFSYLTCDPKTDTAHFTISGNIEKVNPLFSNYTSYDFRLQTNSPAINKGINTGLSYDIDGNSRDGYPDIGAYEYQSGQPVDTTSPAAPQGLSVD